MGTPCTIKVEGFEEVAIWKALDGKPEYMTNKLQTFLDEVIAQRGGTFEPDIIMATLLRKSKEIFEEDSHHTSIATWRLITTTQLMESCYTYVLSKKGEVKVA